MDIIKIGSLTLIGKTNIYYKNRNKDILYEWKCDCGNIVFKPKFIVNKLKNNCGRKCLLKERNPENLLNKKFNRILVTNLSERRSPNHTYWDGICDCGNKVTIRADILKAGLTKSCGCLNDEVRRANCGPKHACFKHGMSNDRGNNHKKWVRAVKKRDNYTCQICNFNNDKKTGVSAHHLNSYCSHPEQRLSLDNGITLCIKCHTNFHSKYGKDVTKILYLEYFNRIKNKEI